MAFARVSLWVVAIWMQESQASSTWRVKWYFTATGGGLGFGWSPLSRVEVNQIAIARVRKMHVTIHASAVDESIFCGSSKGFKK